MGDLEEASTVHYNFPLYMYFPSIYITLKSGIANANEPVLYEYGSLAELHIMLPIVRISEWMVTSNPVTIR